MRKILSLIMLVAVTGCAFTPPAPPQPAESPRVPVNASAPLGSPV